MANQFNKEVMTDQMIMANEIISCLLHASRYDKKFPEKSDYNDINRLRRYIDAIEAQMILKEKQNN